MSWFSDALGWFAGKSVGANLARVAVLGYLTKLLNKNVSNGGGGQEVVDQGVRLQLNPSTDNKIPVLYGEAYFGGYITDAYLSEDYKKMTYVLTLAESTGDLLSTSSASAYTFNNVYFNNNRVVFKADGVTVDYTLDSSGNQDIAFRDLVKVYFYANGTGIQPTGSSGTTPASHTIVPGWDDTNYPMDGLLYAVVEVTYSRANNVTGLPECTFHLTNSLTLPGDVLNDYIQSARYGAGLTSNDIDNSLTALNTFCSTGFTYTDADSQQQTGAITINGLVDTNTDVLTNMEALATAGSAWMSYDIHAGKWSAIINKAGTSTASMSDSHIIGEISVGGTSLTALHNAADVKFQNTDILDKTDYAKINLPAEDLYDNELPNTMQVSLPFTNKQSVAIKLGAQMLKQARVDKMISFTTDYSFVNVRAGDLIDITNPVYGYTNKLFRVISAQEEEGEDATILIKFQCLEYDAAVYDFDVQEYEIETEDGLLSIGAIGKPDVPVVQTIQESNTPRINIIVEVPSGIVDAMEFWITFDTSVPNDADRSYIQIGTYSNPDGSPLTENQSITYTYSQLSQSNFFVKVRGVNNLASGPYSDPTGLVEYVPVVVADTISDTPVDFGGTLMSLGLLTLLNNLDKLYQGISTPGSLFDKIFTVFEEVTGFDIVGETSGGSFVVPTNLSVQSEGEEVVSSTASINFVGDGIVATGVGNDATITVNKTTKEDLAEINVYPNSILDPVEAPPNRTYYANLIPIHFGSGDTYRKYDTRAAIFTDEQLLLANGTAISAFPNAIPVPTGQIKIKLKFKALGYKSYQHTLIKITNKSGSAGNYLYTVGTTSTFADPGNNLNVNDDLSLSTIYNSNKKIYLSAATHDGETSLSDINWGKWYYYNDTNITDYAVDFGVTSLVNPAWKSFNPEEVYPPAPTPNLLLDNLDFTCSKLNPSAYNSIDTSSENGTEYLVKLNLNIPENTLILIGLSPHTYSEILPGFINFQAEFSGQTILSTASGFSFPGYTPISGQTAQIHTKYIDLSVKNTFYSSSNLNIDDIWLEDFTDPADSTVNPTNNFNSLFTSTYNRIVGWTCPEFSIYIEP